MIPMDPPRSLGNSSEEDEEEDCDEGDSKDGGIIKVKLEGETCEKTLHPSDSVALSPGYRPRRKKGEGVKDCEGEFLLLNTLWYYSDWALGISSCKIGGSYLDWLVSLDMGFQSG